LIALRCNSALGVMPGAELHLNAINAAMHRAFVRELPRPVGALLVFAAAAGAILIRRAVRQPFWWFAAQGLATAAWIGAALALYDRADLLLPMIAPLAIFHLNGVTSLVHDVLVARREKNQLRRTLERYVSRDVVEEVVDSPDEYRQALGGELRHVTVLFSDIRDFTRKGRAMRSQELVRQLNEYFSAMVGCVFAHGGTLDKFIGDAVMAVWGSTRRSDPAADARNAVACALAMRRALAQLNAQWAAEGRPQLRIGIALNSGEAVVGNIGSPHRMEFTVIGDAVNIAWRLQERTKDFGDAVLLGEDVVPLLGAEFPCERCGEYAPADGEPVGIARLLEMEHAAIASDPSDNN
jgi:adenylate cyclase